MRIWALLSWYDESPAHLREMVESVAPLVDGVVAVDGAYALYPGAEATSPPGQATALQSACDAADLELIVARPAEPWAGGEVEKRAAMFARALLAAYPFEDWFIIMDGDMLLGPCDVAAAREELEATDLDVAQIEFAELARGSSTHHINLTPFRSLFRAVPGLTVEGTHWLYNVPDDTRPSGRRFMWHGIVKPDDPREFEHAPEPALDLREHVRLLHRPHDREPARVRARDGYYQKRELAVAERVPIYPQGE